jgi:predicted 3'-5' exonuclease similar to PolB exonuclease domain
LSSLKEKKSKWNASTRPADQLTIKRDGVMANDITEKALNEATLRLAWYRESDVINTYRVWLRYELFRGKLTKQSYEASEANLQKFLEGRNTATSQTIKTMESELLVR